MSIKSFSVFLCCYLFFLSLQGLGAAITRFEFVNQPNDGDQVITDNFDNPGPTQLPSFKATIVETPADFIFMNQFNTSAVTAQKINNIADVEEGFDTLAVPLFEGITFLYPYAKNPMGSNTPWFLGPLTIDGALPLLFKVDQGPPRAPTIGGFIIDGGRTQNLQNPNIKSHFVNFSPSNSEFLMEVIFNGHDIQNAASLQVSFIGTVFNNTAIFDADPATDPNPNPVPGAVDRPEALADVVAQLGQILSGVPDTGPPLSVSVIGDVTTKTGPFPLDVALVNTNPPSASNPPDINPAKSGPGLGLFNPLGFDFKTIGFDGSFEISVGARDAFQNLSPGGFNAFGNLANPQPGTPTRILVIRDTISPQDFLLEKPRSVFIFGNTPPSVDPPFEDSIWSIKGSVNDERGDLVQVRVFSQDSPDVDSQVDTSNGLPTGLILTADPNTGILQSVIDSTAWSPLLPTSGQVAYRMGFAPQDLHGNINVANNTELLLIKDTFPPAKPAFTNVKDGDAIKTSIFTIEAVAENDETSVNAEHGRMSFQLSVTLLTPEGDVPVFSVSPPASTSDLVPVTNSVLDDQFLAFTRQLQITDRTGQFTGQIESIVFQDRTSAFNNMVYDKFFLKQAVNFQNVPDGLILLELSLLDQVGNQSEITSVTVIKDTSGPVISLNLLESGPDDNYTTNFPDLPNLFGADDNEFRISLKSPEFTVDDGPGGVFPKASIPDPHFLIQGVTGSDAIGLKLKGKSEDSFGDTTRIDVSSIRIPSFSITTNGGLVDFNYKGTLVTISQPSFSLSQSATFEINIPVFNLIEGLPEVIRIEGVDQRGNIGLATNLTVVRDLTVPDPPIIEVPSTPPNFSEPIHYTNKDVMTISGVTEPGARLVVLLPPLGAPAGFDINQALRIQRTSPFNIPIVGSDYDSVTSACANLTCNFIEADSEGRFQIKDMDISTIASSLSSATTIVVQAIDAFDNTDPVSSVANINVHRNKLQVPVDHLYVSEYPVKGLTNSVEIFPSSVNVMPGLTVFYAVDYVKFRLDTLFPMLEAPDLKFRQLGNIFRPAGKISSTFSAQIGTFSFDYIYDVLARENEFDGRVEFEINGGRDLFGNPVIPTSGPVAFIVDTVAPNEFSEAPIIVLSPTDSTLVTTFASARIDLTDFFKDQLISTDASGVNTALLSLQLFGPLQETPDSLNSVPLQTFIPTQIGFDVAGRLQSPLVTDGTYRLEFLAVDNVGNTVRHRRTFFLDRKQIAAPLLQSLPAHGAFISTMPFSQEYGFYNSLIIQDINADMSQSDFELFGPAGGLLATTPTVIISGQTVIRSLLSTSIPKTDGSSDGIYSLKMDVYDGAGNRTQKTHQYIFDSISPVINLTYPGNGECVSLLNMAKFQASEDTSYAADVSGLDRNRSYVSLTLIDPHKPFNPSSEGRVINSTVTFLSSDANQNATQTVALNIMEGAKGLPRGGSFDGLYELSGRVFDRAGNHATSMTTFVFDSRPPTLSVSGFGDYDYLTNQAFRFSGTIQDSGSCGLISSGVNHYATSQLSLNIYAYDRDSDTEGALLAGPFFSESIDVLNPTSFAVDSSQGTYLISGTFPGGHPAALFRFQFTDRAGNLGHLERKVVLKDTLPTFPQPNFPRAFTDFRGERLQTFVTSPLQILSWSAVPEARSYRLHLSRESITPGVRTTFVELPNYKTSYSVDYSLVNSVAGTVVLTDRDQFYWLVESLDGIGQGSDPNIAFGRGEKLEFDQRALDLHLDQLKIIINDQELNLDSVNAFATGTSIKFKWYLPEPVRLRGDEKVYLEFERDNSKQHMASWDGYPIETDQLIFLFPMPDRKINGIANLFLEGFRDRAGNKFGSLKAVFKVDKGPEIQLKIFQNPVDPAAFGFAFKGRDFQGLDDILRYDPEISTPQAYISEGFRDLVEIPLIALRETIINGQRFANGFTGAFVVSRQYVGDVRLKFFAEDFRGFKTEEDVLLHVLPQESASIASIHKLNHSSGSVSYRLLNPNPNGERPVVMTSRKFVDLDRVPVFKAPSKRLTLSEFPHFFGDSDLWLRYSSSIQVTGDCDKNIFIEYFGDINLLPKQKVDCSTNGSMVYEIETTAPNKVFLMKDLAGPELQGDMPTEIGVEDQQVKFFSHDDLSGVSEVWLKIQGNKFKLDRVGQNDYQTTLNLKPGEWQVELGASDMVGNISKSSFNLNILRPLEFDRCFVAPNPVISGSTTFLNCDISRVPDEIGLSIYDTAGKRVNHWQGPTEAKFRESIDLISSEGLELSNGVYFLKLRVRAGTVWIKKTFKVAIVRL